MGNDTVHARSARDAGRPTSSAQSKALWTLVVVNVVLLLCWAMKATAPNEAIAQIRRPADYLMIPGEVVSGNSEAVYVVDTSNGMLGAINFDDTTGKVSVMPSINLNSVFQAASAGGGGGGGGRRY